MDGGNAEIAGAVFGLPPQSSVGWAFNSGAGHPALQQIAEDRDDMRLLPRALRADSDVRFGILPPQSSLRRDDV
jgi:hypothetical protein